MGKIAEKIVKKIGQKNCEIFFGDLTIFNSFSDPTGEKFGTRKFSGIFFSFVTKNHPKKCYDHMGHDS